jgi:tRNA(fMet)-specific endonuclease VapC
MKYLVDSNIIIALVLGVGEHLRERAAACDADDLVTSSIAFAEVAYGSVKGRPPAFDDLQAFVEEVPILDFDYKAALTYASLPFKRASYDRLIAAHALSHDLTLVTDNTSDFSDLPELRVENWFR